MIRIRTITSASLFAAGVGVQIHAMAQSSSLPYALESSPDIPSITTKAQQDSVITLLSAHLGIWAARRSAEYPYEQIVTPQAVFEYPYAYGAARRVEGREAIAKAVGQRSQIASDWHFNDLKLFQTAHRNVFFVAYTSTAADAATGQPYKQTYLARITVKDGKIDNYLELWDRGLEPPAL
ncbi:MAG: nuclear transport factor 2 family protein [Betaproteobacteria bacterium]